MKKFLLTFFENEKYAGWQGIAEKLIDSGTCIVAGLNCIWIGGIGNFIKTELYEDAYNCSLYTFDLESFKQSAWFKEKLNEYSLTLQEEITNRTNELNELVDQMQELTQ